MFLNDNTLDNGLAALKSGADKTFICSAEPATYTQATSTYALGNNNFGAGAVFPGVIAAGSPSGRKLTRAAITAGAVTANGTATHIADVTSASTRLETATSLTASQAVTSGNTFSLAAADVRLPNTGG